MKVGDFVSVVMNYSHYIVRIDSINDTGISGFFAYAPKKGKYEKIAATGLFLWKEMLSCKVTKRKLTF